MKLFLLFTLLFTAGFHAPIVIAKSNAADTQAAPSLYYSCQLNASLDSQKAIVSCTHPNLDPTPTHVKIAYLDHSEIEKYLGNEYTVYFFTYDLERIFGDWELEFALEESKSVSAIDNNPSYNYVLDLITINSQTLVVFNFVGSAFLINETTEPLLSLNFKLERAATAD